MSAAVTALGDIAKFVNGFAFKQSQWAEEGLPIIRIQNLTDSKKPYNRTIHDPGEKYHVENGDILVSWSATLDVFEWSGGPAYVNQHIFKVSPDYTKVDGQYLLHALRDAIIRMMRHTRGAVMKHINRGDFLATEIPLPELGEQQRIAAVLDKTDAIRRKRQQAIDLADELLRSVFLEMFGDPAVNPNGFEEVSLSSLVTLRDKINYGIVQPGDEYKNGVPVVRVGDFANGKVNPEELKRVNPRIDEKHKKSRLHGDEILLSCVGSIGLVALATRALAGMNIVRAVARIRVADEVNRIWLYQYLQTAHCQRHLRKETRTVSQPTLNIGLIESAPVILAPKEAQDRFAAIAERFSVIAGQQDEAIRLSDSLFKSISQRAFKGKL